MNKMNVNLLVRVSILAALYFVLTVLVSPLSYGAIQFRFSEVLVLLVFYKKEYGISLILGCFLANLFSPLGWVDVVFGTFATAITVFFMTKVKNLFIATLIPTLFCIIVGIELHYVSDLPLIITTLQVMAGEFVVVTILGYPLFRVLEKNQAFMNFIGVEKEE